LTPEQNEILTHELLISKYLRQFTFFNLLDSIYGSDQLFQIKAKFPGHCDEKI